MVIARKRNDMMIGNHVIPVIVDAYLKGIKNFDVDLAYRVQRKFNG
jgi:putative alpha-1,2-mannosidase